MWSRFFTCLGSGALRKEIEPRTVTIGETRTVVPLVLGDAGIAEPLFPARETGREGCWQVAERQPPELS
jgi:hypothetical protein